MEYRTAGSRNGRLTFRLDDGRDLQLGRDDPQLRHLHQPMARTCLPDVIGDDSVGYFPSGGIRALRAALRFEKPMVLMPVSWLATSSSGCHPWLM